MIRFPKHDLPDHVWVNWTVHVSYYVCEACGSFGRGQDRDHVRVTGPWPKKCDSDLARINEVLNE